MTFSFFFICLDFLNISQCSYNYSMITFYATDASLKLLSNKYLQNPRVIPTKQSCYNWFTPMVVPPLAMIKTQFIILYNFQINTTLKW